MAKQITCGDVVPGCDWKASAQSEDELLVRTSPPTRRRPTASRR